MLVVSAEPGVKSDLLQATLLRVCDVRLRRDGRGQAPVFHRALKFASLLALSSRAYRLMAELQKNSRCSLFFLNAWSRRAV
jgi:hypothetical protein